LRDDDWTLGGWVIYASTMGTLTMGVVSIGNEGGRTHEGLVVYVFAVDARIEGFEGTSEAWSGY